uniref:regulator of nonsense transcripts 3B-like n=1 Tax=Ciona intestinalis TaxID=7719 RepID=UPI000052277C|nr:regulator of nonsense transcripts 3B-like [Ciona intestinalis]|eukprot:XP_009859726.1 regulator of nonsense transcripts 3B-like [Ciona intestinalis]
MSKAPEDTEDLKEEKKSKRREKTLIQTKVVMRRLPPGLTEEQFKELIGTLPPHDYFRFVSGDRTLVPNNFCRAYINFINTDDIFKFRDRFDGHEFEFKNGTKHPCVVEFAPFQKIPRKNRKKEDLKVDTIEQDPDYQKFLETLDEEEEKEILDVEKYLDELELREKKNHKMVETPLTAFIKQKRDERKKVRDERRKADLERRKKKEEERKKRRDVEKKKKIEAEKIKRKKEANLKENGKKTLGETRPDPPTQNDPDAQSSSRNHEDTGEKLKILQKDGPNDKITKSKAGDINPSKEFGKGPKPKGPTTKEFYHKKWKEEDVKKKRVKASDQTERPEEKFKPKKPDLEIYRPSSPGGRGGGYRASAGSGRGSRPQKYSEQRNRAAKKSETEK